MTNKITNEEIDELMVKSLEIDNLKTEIKNLEAFVDAIVKYDDLPPSEMVLDEIIKEAKTFKDTGWVKLNPDEEW
jgi:hypothetical protein